MAPTALVTYLAMEHGAAGLGVGLVLAAPRVVALLRLAVPRWIPAGPRRKAVCIGAFFVSALALLVMPIAAAPAQRPAGSSLVALIGFWTAYQVLELIGALALWAWLGDHMPPQLRGRLVGARERWLLIGKLVGMGLSLLVVATAGTGSDPASRGFGLSASAVCGACCMLLAVAPLARMAASPPSTRRSLVVSSSRPTGFGARAALGVPGYRDLLVFSVAFSAANALTAAGQQVYVRDFLRIGYDQLVPWIAMMLAGQTLLAKQAGTWCDRFGARRVLAFSQPVVALGVLAISAAAPGQTGWLGAAYAVWIVYAATNVALDVLKLQLAPPADRAPALAIYHALSDLVYAVVTVAAGVLIQDWKCPSAFVTLLLVGWLLRTAVAGLAWRIRGSR